MLTLSGFHPLAIGPKVVFSQTSMWGNNEYDWLRNAILLSSGGRSSMFFPSISIEPDVCSVSPEISLSNVVFPAPVGPRIVRYSPSFTSRSRLSIATRSPKTIFRFRILMSGILFGPPCDISHQHQGDK